MSSRCLDKDRYIRPSHMSSEDIFKRRLAKNFFKISSRRLEDVSSSQTALVKWSSRRLRDVFNTFLRRTEEAIIYRKICLGHNSEKFMVRVQNL